MQAKKLSRRNLTPEAASYLRGRRYNAEKLEPGRPEKGDQSDPVKTSDRLAEEFKVGSATIKRDGKFAEAVDLIAGNCGGDVRQLQAVLPILVIEKLQEKQRRTGIEPAEPDAPAT